MENIYDKRVYVKEDIEKAYDMGLENAIVVLEKCIGLSVNAQVAMLNTLKRMRNENRIKPIFKKELI